jgi:hypothetical protein
MPPPDDDHLPALIERSALATARERTGFGILVALLQFGILSDDLTRPRQACSAARPRATRPAMCR